jgi:hypothetical protein
MSLRPAGEAGAARQGRGAQARSILRSAGPLQGLLQADLRWVANASIECSGDSATE